MSDFKLVLKTTELQEVLELICLITPKKSVEQLVTGVGIDKKSENILFTGTNMNTFIFVNRAIPKQTEDVDFNCVVNAFIFKEIIAKMKSETVFIEKFPNKIDLIENQNVFSLNLTNNQLPVKNLVDFQRIFTIQSKIFVSLLDQSYINADENEGGHSRLIINNNVLFSMIKDHRRMSVAQIDLHDSCKNCDCTFQLKNIDEIRQIAAKAKEISFLMGKDNELLFQADDNVKLLCKLFPVPSGNYLHLLNTDLHECFACETKVFKDQLKKIIPIV